MTGKALFLVLLPHAVAKRRTYSRVCTADMLILLEVQALIFTHPNAPGGLADHQIPVA